MVQFQLGFGYIQGVVGRLRWIAILLAGFTASLAFGQKGSWFISGFSGQSIIAFSSSDSRISNSFGLARSFGDIRRFKKGSHPGELIAEGYYDFSKSHGAKRFPPNTTSAWGFLVYSRYRWYAEDAPTSFFDIGWGLQDASRPTRDLDSRLNSTPMIDFGWIVGSNDHERAFIGARILHISNANTKGDNRGQNQIFLFMQIPF